jgi:hypothetical protein
VFWVDEVHKLTAKNLRFQPGSGLNHVPAKELDVLTDGYGGPAFRPEADGLAASFIGFRERLLPFLGLGSGSWFIALNECRQVLVISSKPAEELTCSVAACALEAIILIVLRHVPAPIARSAQRVKSHLFRYPIYVILDVTHVREKTPDTVLLTFVSDPVGFGELLSGWRLQNQRHPDVSKSPVGIH